MVGVYTLKLATIVGILVKRACRFASETLPLPSTLFLSSRGYVI